MVKAITDILNNLSLYISMTFSVFAPSGYVLPLEQMNVISKSINRGLNYFSCGGTSYHVFYVSESNTWYVKCRGAFNKTVALRSV